MTTLLITEIFPPQTGGSGRWFWEIYRRLPRAEFLVAAGEHPRQEEFDCTHDLRLHRLPLKMQSWGIRSWGSLRVYCRAILALRRIVLDKKVAMIHCGRCLPEGLIALALRFLTGAEFGCYVHGEDIIYPTTSRELTWLTQQVVKRSAFFVANSQNTARILREVWGVASTRIQVMHPGVDAERFTPARRDPAARARLGWGNRLVVLTVGRLQQRKGQDLMIMALKQIRQAIPDVLYAIVGDGEQREALRVLVAQYHLDRHVQFRGEIDDEGLRDCYQQCDLFALPNRQVGPDIEGFGMVLLEAQACGRPVLAGTSGGTAETMRIPETGRVVSCDGPDDLASAVIELLSDPARLDQMGAAGRQWAAEHFDWGALSQQALKLFERQEPRSGR